MILPPDKLEEIAQAAAEAQRRIYYESERYEPGEHDIGKRLARRELSLIQSVIRELVILGWTPPSKKLMRKRCARSRQRGKSG